MWMPVTTGHHGRPPDRMDELDNFLPEDKAAARDFLLEIKPLFPLIEIPAFWDDDEGIELIKHLSWYISATVVLADWTGSSTRFFPVSYTHLYWPAAVGAGAVGNASHLIAPGDSVVGWFCCDLAMGTRN